MRSGQDSTQEIIRPYTVWVLVHPSIRDIYHKSVLHKFHKKFMHYKVVYSIGMLGKSSKDEHLTLTTPNDVQLLLEFFNKDIVD